MNQKCKVRTLSNKKNKISTISVTNGRRTNTNNYKTRTKKTERRGFCFQITGNQEEEKV